MPLHRKILVVDDEDDIREIASISLDLTQGWELQTASCGLEALDIAAEFQPDAILLDLHAGALQQVAGAGMEEVDADLLQDRHGLLVDLLHVLARQDLVRLEAVLPHGDSNSASSAFLVR